LNVDGLALEDAPAVSETAAAAGTNDDGVAVGLKEVKDDLVGLQVFHTAFQTVQSGVELTVRAERWGVAVVVRRTIGPAC